MHAWRFKLLGYMNQTVALAVGICASDSLAPSYFCSFLNSVEILLQPLEPAVGDISKRLQTARDNCLDNSTIVLGYLGWTGDCY